MSAVPTNETTTARNAPSSRLQPPPPAGIETLDWDEPPSRPVRRSRGALVVAILSSLLTLGLGYVSWQLWAAQQGALTTLGQTQTQLKTVEQQHTKDAQQLSEQQQLLAQQKQQAKQDAADLGEVKAKLGAAEARLGELQEQSEALNEHLAEFHSLTKQFQRMIDSGKLQINFRRGRMIVELPAAVLFASGSAELSNDGKASLREIAKILRKVPGKRFMVGGHTDDVPITKNSAYSSNWALSAARAVTVTESLIDSGLRANHLVAAGYGEYDPIASNATERGRQKNRRIEIVLEPQLGSLPNTLAELKKSATAKPAKKRHTKAKR